MTVIPVLAACSLLGEYYHFASCGLFLCVLAVFSILFDRTSQQHSELEAVAYCVLLVAAFEMASLAMSHYRPNSLPGAATVFFAALVYCLVRLSLRSRAQVVAYSSIIALCGVCLSVSSLTRFSESLAKLNAAGFADIVPFREKLTVASGNVLAGEWFTIVLLTTPYALLLSALAFSSGRRILGALATIPTVIIVLELTATCSRAVVSALIVGLIVLATLALAYRLISLKSGLTLLACFLGGLALVLLIGNILLPSLASCYMGRDTSQARSAEGRVAIWRAVMDAAQGSRLWGVGSGNSGFLLTSHADDSADTAFAARTFSLPVEIVVEKGIAGAACYFLLLFAIVFELHRTLRNRALDGTLRWMALVAFSGIVMSLVRDLAYSSLTAHRVTLALFFSLMALLSAAREIQCSEPVPATAQRRNRR